MPPLHSHTVPTRFPRDSHANPTRLFLKATFETAEKTEQLKRAADPDYVPSGHELGKAKAQERMLNAKSY